MRKAMLLLAVLGLASSLWAEDLRVGTWKLSFAKSKMPSSAQQALKEETLVVREVGDHYEVSSTGKEMDGSPFSSQYTIPLQGGAAKYQNGAPPEGVSDIFTIVDANTMYLTRLQNGKQVIALRSVISKDGKTMQNKTRGIDADGKPFERVTVFERQ
jgi:hypothetical protein